MLWLLACGGEVEVPRSLDSAPPTETAAPVDTARPAVDSLLVVVIDTLRADHLGFAGHDRDVSPHLDALAAESQVFARGTSQAFWTHPTMGSFFTGLHPLTHGCCSFAIGDEAGEPLHTALQTLPEQLSAAGLATHAVMKSWPVAGVGGFEQGFDGFDWIDGDAADGESAEQLLEPAVATLEGLADAPFFLYVHFMDPHAGYAAPEPWLGTWSDAYDSEISGDMATIAELRSGLRTASEEDRQRLLALYDEEIAYVDDAIGQLLDALAASPAADRTAVMVLADHGEEFGEHGGWAHQEIWQELLHVPMLVKVPGVTGATHEGRVQTIDLTTTAATLLGVEPHGSWAGRDLRAAWTGELAATDVVSGADQSYSLIRDELKLVRRVGEPDALFDLAVDPGEQADLAATHPDELATLAAALDGHLADHTATGTRLRGD